MLAGQRASLGFPLRLHSFKDSTVAWFGVISDPQEIHTHPFPAIVYKCRLFLKQYLAFAPYQVGAASVTVSSLDLSRQALNHQYVSI